MLHDIAANAQQISAVLPPNDWDLGAPKSRIVREPSGVFDLVYRNSEDDTDSEQLIIDESEPPESPPNNTEGAAKPSWLRRVFGCLCRCFCGRRKEG